MSSRSLRLVLIAFMVVSALSAPAFLIGGAAAAGTLDQEQAVVAPQGYLSVASGKQLAAQIFRAGRTGALDQVAVHVGFRPSRLNNGGDSPEPPGPGDLIAQIRTLDANELPTATILASGSVAESNFASGNPRGWLTIALPSPASVTAGTKYALVLTSTQQGGGYLWSQTEQNDPYPDGFQAFRTANSTSWMKFAGTSDFAFRTYVSDGATPSPSPSASPSPSPSPPTSPGPVPSFADVPTDYWAYAQIQQFAARGITTGCDANLYCPERSVTRAEMAAFIIRTVTGTTAAPAGPAIPTFADVPTTHPQYGFIEALVAREVTTGCRTEGTVRYYCPDGPDDNVTRAEMAAFLIRALTGTTAAPTGPATPTFADVLPTHPQYGYIEALVARGVTTGCRTEANGQRFYCPGSDVTRAEMAVFIIRAFP